MLFARIMSFTAWPQACTVLQVVSPVVLPIPGPGGHYRQGLGLAVFLNSRGEVTAYHASGELAWQVSEKDQSADLHQHCTCKQ